MSHSGITPLPEDQDSYNKLVPSGLLLPSGEANFFDFRQHTSSDWDLITPSAIEDGVYASPSSDLATINSNYKIEDDFLRHKEYKLSIDPQSTLKKIVGSGINYPFPYPYNKSFPFNAENEMFSEKWWEASGIFKTYPPASGRLIDKVAQSGIFHYDKFRQVENFSNANIDNERIVVPDSGIIFSSGITYESKGKTVIFVNNYIHYHPAVEDYENPTRGKLKEPDPKLTILENRFKQKRQFIQTPFLVDVSKKTEPVSGNYTGYKYNEDGNANDPSEIPFATGMCVYADGKCADGITRVDCLAYPGAVWTMNQKCPEEED